MWIEPLPIKHATSLQFVAFLSPYILERDVISPPIAFSAVGVLDRAQKRHSASERRGYSFEGFKSVDLKDKARVWP